MPGANEKAGLQASQLYTVIFPDVVGIVLLSATRHFPNSATRPNVNFRRRDHPVPRLKIENGLSDRDRSADRVTWVPSRSGTGASTIREAQRCRLTFAATSICKHYQKIVVLLLQRLELCLKRTELVCLGLSSGATLRKVATVCRTVAKRAENISDGWRSIQSTLEPESGWPYWSTNGFDDSTRRRREQ